MRYTLYAIVIINGFLFWSCASTSTTSAKNEKSKITIAFGSCSHQWEAQPIWSQIAKNKPDLWIWLGDIIYADTEDMTKMNQDYTLQKQHVDYMPFAQSTEILGVWDDHDYGVNDGGKEYPQKDSSKLLLFEFLGLNPLDSIHDHPGAYQSHLIRRGDLSIKVLLLDARYFRDPPSASNASVLGTQQWQWLINELTLNNADVHIIASGIQVLPEDHKYEKWANFGQERMRLLQVIDLMKVNHPILLSGDRHLAEFTLVALPQSGEPLLEITSSGLTHSYHGFTEETNKHRIGEVYPLMNFGVLKIEKEDTFIDYSASIKSEKNKTVQTVNSYDLYDLLENRSKQ